MNSGRNDKRAEQDAGWSRRFLQGNTRAILPLYFACLGSYCWEVAALWGGANNIILNSLWEVLILAGAVLLFLGLIGGIIYRHCKASQGAILISILSPPIWFWLLCKLHGFLEPDAPQSFIVVLYLYLQIPLLVIALWRSPWQKRVKIVLTASVATAMICHYSVHTLQAQQEVAVAPHVSDDYLTRIYRRNDTSAIARLNGKRIVVTGIAGGQSEGLFGGGPPEMQTKDGQIECDTLGPFDAVEDGQTVSILGTCKGKDEYGKVHLTECRTVER